MKNMITVFYTVATAYVLIMIGMYTLQRQLLYLPDRNIEAPDAYGLSGFRDLMITSTDGMPIQLWHRQATDGFPTIVYYHGNASHLGNRAGILGALANKGFGVLALSYRGYGKSQGKPSETGLYNDARAAVKFLTDKERLPLSRIMLYGESLGSGVAVHIATEFHVGGLMLQAPYKSVAGRAAEIYFFIPVNLLIKDRFDSIHKIARVKAPLLIFHGDLDDTIPVTHGKAILAAATAPKQAFFFPHISHNDFDSELISAHVLDFARQYKLVTP